jgi:hypothetical protein
MKRVWLAGRQAGRQMAAGSDRVVTVKATEGDTAGDTAMNWIAIRLVMIARDSLRRHTGAGEEWHYSSLRGCTHTHAFLVGELWEGQQLVVGVEHDDPSSAHVQQQV